MSRRALLTLSGLCVAGVLLAWVAGPVAASMMADKGSVSGRVLMSDGKPAAISLRLEQTVPMGVDKGDRKPRASWIDSGATTLQGERQGNVKIVARVTTDKEGKFTIPNLEQGAYTLVGGSKSLGWIYYPVEVEAGKETKLGDITLTKG